MKAIYISTILLLVISILTVNSCKKEKEEPEPQQPTAPKNPTTVKDIDGNVYSIVKIGEQFWTKENLKTTKFSDGSGISNVTDNTAWSNWALLSSPAWCNYENSADSSAIYGKLYNWYTVADPRKVCPTGWHVPTDSEWTVLTDFLGGAPVAGVKMKTTYGWNDYNGLSGNGSNESGFSGLPGGLRNGYSGEFLVIGDGGGWWSSSESSSTNSWNRSLDYNSGPTYRNGDYKQSGFSVRCLKD